MVTIVDFINNNFGVLAFLCGALYFIIPKLYTKIKKDGYQGSDVSEAINEGMTDYKALITSIEGVIKDVTVNDADTVKAITSMIEAKKILK